MKDLPRQASLPVSSGSPYQLEQEFDAEHQSYHTRINTRPISRSGDSEPASVLEECEEGSECSPRAGQRQV